MVWWVCRRELGEDKGVLSLSSSFTSGAFSIAISHVTPQHSRTARPLMSDFLGWYGVLFFFYLCLALYILVTRSREKAESRHWQEAAKSFFFLEYRLERLHIAKKANPNYYHLTTSYVETF